MTTPQQNLDSLAGQGEFHSKRPADEPLTHKGVSYCNPHLHYHRPQDLVLTSTPPNSTSQESRSATTPPPSSAPRYTSRAKPQARTHTSPTRSQRSPARHRTTPRQLGQTPWAACPAPRPGPSTTRPSSASLRRARRAPRSTATRQSAARVLRATSDTASPRRRAMAPSRVRRGPRERTSRGVLLSSRGRRGLVGRLREVSTGLVPRVFSL